ncbi:MAG: class I SAM-dependent methyltransferase [Desulfobacterales bacterium]|nr:MAG: class I SAM-dependent methyltransferase [Desulfobacterales bacterium]
MITVDFNKLNIQPGFKILDIGCGSGRHTCAAYQCRDVVAIGADINLRDLVTAKDRLNLHDQLGEHGGGTWGLSVADMTRLPFKNNYFDLVIASEVMEHIPEHENAAKEVIRVLKPGSMLVVSVPRYWPERICWGLSEDYCNSSQGHIRIYKSKELVALLEGFGLKKWAIHYAHSLHTPFWWLKCLLGPTRENSLLVNLYHRFLTWDIMRQPRGTRFLDNMLNPILGKSVVVYLRK